jgi:hypothetical protein
MKRVKYVVQDILHRKPETRDDDVLLYGWVLMNAGTDIKEMSASTLLRRMQARTLPSLNTVIRIRARLQEQREDLRGFSYAKRHRLQEPVKAELRAI